MRILKTLASMLGMELTCEECDELIVDAMEGDLSLRDKMVYRMHLFVCRNCRDYVDGYVSTVDMARHAYDDQTSADMPEDLVQSILKEGQRQQ